MITFYCPIGLLLAQFFNNIQYSIYCTLLQQASDLASNSEICSMDSSAQKSQHKRTLNWCPVLEGKVFWTFPVPTQLFST